MISYKQIIKNMVEDTVEDFVWKTAERIATVNEITLDKLDTETIRFIAKIEVGYKDFEVHGCMDDRGNTWIGSIEYTVMRCTEKDENGDWITASAREHHRFIYGDALKTFKFDW